MLGGSRRRLPLLLLAIFLLALALRVVAVSLFGVPDVVRTTESGIVARNVVEGRGYTYDFYGTRRDNPLQSFVPPLFPALIALCLYAFDDPARALEFIQAVLSSLTAVLIYFIAAKLSLKRSVGLLAAIGTALYPVSVVMCAYPSSLTLNVFLLSLFLLASITLQEKATLGRATLTGFLLGIAVLSRPMLLGLLPVVLIWLWISSQRDRTKLLKLGATVAAFVVVVILPWTLRNYSVHGQVVLIATNGGFNFWNGNNPFTTGSGHEVYTELVDAFLGVPHDPQSPEVVELRPYPLPEEVQEQLSTIDEVEMEQVLYQAGLGFIQGNPGRWLELVIAKLKGFWWFRSNIGASYEASWTEYYKILYIVLLVLFIPGVSLSLRHWRRYALLYLLFVYYLLFYVIFHVQTRYRWEIEPYFLIFAAFAVSLFLKKMGLVQDDEPT